MAGRREGARGGGRGDTTVLDDGEGRVAGGRTTFSWARAKRPQLRMDGRGSQPAPRPPPLPSDCFNNYTYSRSPPSHGWRYYPSCACATA